MPVTRAIRTVCLFSLGLSAACLAGTPLKWDDVPAPVRPTVLAHGGKAGMTVDREQELTHGQATYEAGVKADDGTIHDLVVTADGTLVETKTDDAADAAGERADRAARLLQGVSFSHPRDLTNPYLPLSGVRQDVLEGNEGGKPVRVERTAKPDVHKTVTLAGKQVEAMAFEDRAYENGKLVEVALDYFAQDDAGTVYYLGEDVDEYENGKLKSHEGSWLVGRDTPAVGVLFPGKPTVGAAWRSEDVSAEITERDEVVSVSETVVTPLGAFADCVKVKETTPDEVEYKYYAKGVGVVREQPPEGDVVLVRHGLTAK